MGLASKMFMSWLFHVISFIFQHQQGEKNRIPSCTCHRWTSRTWVRQMQWIPGRQRVRCFCKEITLVKVDCINLCIYIYVRVWVCATLLHIRVLYIYIHWYWFILCIVYFHFCVCLCVRVCVRSGACGRPKPQDRDVFDIGVDGSRPSQTVDLGQTDLKILKTHIESQIKCITSQVENNPDLSCWDMSGCFFTRFHMFSPSFWPWPADWSAGRARELHELRRAARRGSAGFRLLI